MNVDCPPGTHWIGPNGPGEIHITVNGRTSGRCVKPDGTPHGHSITWYESGAKAAAGNYKDGLKEDLWLYWHENGQLSGKGAFLAGKPEGPWITWHDNGERASEGVYVRGAQHGLFTLWSR